MIASERADTNSKQKIRNRYKGVDPSELEVIPAIATDEVALEQRKLKVAAYVRVSTENDEQTSSYELQVNDFTDRIENNPNWEVTEKDGFVNIAMFTGVREEAAAVDTKGKVRPDDSADSGSVGSGGDYSG